MIDELPDPNPTDVNGGSFFSWREWLVILGAVVVVVQASLAAYLLTSFPSQPTATATERFSVVSDQTLGRHNISILQDRATGTCLISVDYRDGVALVQVDAAVCTAPPAPLK